MKVMDKSLLINLESYKKADNEKQVAQKTANGGKSSVVSYKDRVALSSQAKQIQDAASLVQDLPDVREEKVNRIRNEIRRNTYTVDAQKIAGKMLIDSLENENIE